MNIIYKILRRHLFGLMSLPLAPLGFCFDEKPINAWIVGLYTFVIYGIFSFIYDFKPFVVSMSDSDRIEYAGVSYQQYIMKYGRLSALFYLFNRRVLKQFFFYY